MSNLLIEKIVTIINVIFLFLILIDALYILKRDASKSQVVILALLVSIIVTIVGYMIEINANDEKQALAGVSFAYLGKPFALVCSILFIADYCGKRIKYKTTLVLAIVSAFFSLIVFTNNYHNLYYSSIEFIPDQLFSPLKLGHGILYFAYAAFIIFNFTWALVLSIQEIINCKTKIEKEQAWLLFWMIGSVVVGYLAYLAGITAGYDSTLIGTLLSIVFMSILVFKYNLIDYLSFAKTKSLDESSDGILVVGNRNEKVYTNSMANKLLAENIKFEELLKLPEGITLLENDYRTYKISKMAITNGKMVYGNTIEIRDVTAEQDYSNRLKKDVENRTKQILCIQRAIISSFAGIVEARDSSTGVHIKRMSKYVQIIAEGLAKKKKYKNVVDEKFIQCIVDVSPLHDIGKISLPDSILLKPAKLTEEEFNIIKTHTIKGAEIIDSFLNGLERKEYVKMAKDVALYHHEKWAGNGYPKGLSGENIPLSARIVALADVYDAVRSERCYKPPMDRVEAKQVIIDGRGTHFDPDLVDAFLSEIDRIEMV